MNRFRKILVWIEDSDAGIQAIGQAAAVARETGASVTLAHCIEPAPRLLDVIYARAGELRLALRSAWEKKLDSLAGRLRDEGLDARIKLLEGRPFLAFSEEVLRTGHDLLVKPAEDTTAAGGVRLGSNDMHVLRKCPCAVWITGTEEPGTGALLALVDPDPDNMELNERLLQIGSSLAASRGTDLHVAHVWEAQGVSLLTKHVPPPEVATYTERAERRAREDLTTLLSACEVELPPERVHLPRGSVRDVVPRLLEEQAIGLVVMGTVSRTGIRGLLIGNTAETILARVACPVLTVKPADFVSPVTLADA